MLGVRLCQLALLAASAGCLLGACNRRLGRWALAALAVAGGLLSGTAVGVDLLARLMHLPAEEMRYDAVLLFACGASVAALMGAGASWLAGHPL